MLYYIGCLNGVLNKLSIAAGELNSRFFNNINDTNNISSSYKDQLKPHLKNHINVQIIPPKMIIGLSASISFEIVN